MSDQDLMPRGDQDNHTRHDGPRFGTADKPREVEVKMGEARARDTLTEQAPTAPSTFGTAGRPREIFVKLGQNGAVSEQAPIATNNLPEGFGRADKPRDVSGGAPASSEGVRSVGRGTSESLFSADRVSSNVGQTSERVAFTGDKVETPSGTARHLAGSMKAIAVLPGEKILVMNKGVAERVRVFFEQGAPLRPNLPAAIMRCVADALARPDGVAPNWGEVEVPIVVKAEDVQAFVLACRRQRPNGEQRTRLIEAMRAAFRREREAAEATMPEPLDSATDVSIDPNVIDMPPLESFDAPAGALLQQTSQADPPSAQGSP